MKILFGQLYNFDEKLKTEDLYGTQRKIPRKLNFSVFSFSLGAGTDSSFLTTKDSTSLKIPQTFRDELLLAVEESLEQLLHIFGLGETITRVFWSNMPQDTPESKLSEIEK